MEVSHDDCEEFAVMSGVYGFGRISYVKNINDIIAVNHLLGAGATG